MRLAVVAVGRLKSGPERDLVERYRERVNGLARPLGFASLEMAEVVEGRARREVDRRLEEGEALRAKAGTATLLAFDERGASLTSEALAARIAGWRDEGRPALACLVGGPDGLDSGLRQSCELVLSFGRLTLPHQLVRALVVEQVYRCLTILAGHPYHRGGDD